MTVLSTTRRNFHLEVPASAAAVTGLRKFQGFEPASLSPSVVNLLVLSVMMLLSFLALWVFEVMVLRLSMIS